MDGEISSMNLDRYFRRIGFDGDAKPDLATLTRLHRLHLEAIPYENLDVQLGRPVGFDIEAIFDKLVLSRRGGWCYEMNGLFAWALERIGFRPIRMAGGVLRERLGDRTVGGHLVLCVHLDRAYLADVGFGDGLIEPVPITPGPIQQRFLGFTLAQLDDGWWRFHNHPQGGAASFDFQIAEASPAVLAERCQWLQSSPDSGFVQNAVCQRFSRDALLVLRGRVLKAIRAEGTQQTVIGNLADYRATLRTVFGIEVDVTPFWDRISARHEEWLRAQKHVASGGG
jgi:arylamine N-acetyltransferase